MVKINNFAIVKLLEGFYAIEDLCRVGDRVLCYEKSLYASICRVNDLIQRFSSKDLVCRKNKGLRTIEEFNESIKNVSPEGWWY